MMVFTRSFHRAEMIMAAVHQRGTDHLLMGQLSCIWLMMLMIAYVMPRKVARQI